MLRSDEGGCVRTDVKKEEEVEGDDGLGGPSIEMGVRSYTTRELKNLAARPRTEVFGFEHDETRDFKPLPIHDAQRISALLFKWSTELYERIPEVKDDDIIRGIVLEEHPQDTIRYFVDHYVVSAMLMTSKYCSDSMVKKLLLFQQEQHDALVECEGDMTKYKNRVAGYMRRNMVYANVRNFAQLRGVDEFPFTPVTDAVRKLLHTRRQHDARPGAGVRKISELQAQECQHVRLQESQQASRGQATTAFDGVADSIFEALP